MRHFICTNPGSDLLHLAYAYGTTNNNGNLLSQTIVRPGQSWTESYTAYDGINRLTAASEGSGWSQTYGYDNFGNRAVLTGVVNAYATPTALTQYTNNRWTGGAIRAGQSGAGQSGAGQSGTGKSGTPSLISSISRPYHSSRSEIQGEIRGDVPKLEESQDGGRKAAKPCSSSSPSPAARLLAPLPLNIL